MSAAAQFLFKPANAEQKQAADLIRSSAVSIVVGCAGTGKTTLALGVAFEEVFAGRSEGIILSRPAVTAGEEHGFLPGDLDEKMDPWLAAAHDCLRSLTFQDHESLFKQYVERAPLGFMRGRTIARRILIMDEAENLTRRQIRMVLTRLGQGGRLILTGDTDQGDLPLGQSGLDDAAALLGGLSVRDAEGEDYKVSVIRLKEVVRHPLVSAINKRLSHF